MKVNHCPHDLLDSAPMLMLNEQQFYLLGPKKVKQWVIRTVILPPMVSVICRTQPLLRQHHQHHLDVGGTFKLSERKACSRRRCC